MRYRWFNFAYAIPQSIQTADARATLEYAVNAYHFVMYPLTVQPGARFTAADLASTIRRTYASEPHTRAVLATLDTVPDLIITVQPGPTF